MNATTLTGKVAGIRFGNHRRVENDRGGFTVIQDGQQVADFEVEELPGEVDVDIMDEVRGAIVGACYPTCAACRGLGGDEATEAACAACGGLGCILPEKAS